MIRTTWIAGFFLALCMSTTMHARPDVFFTDSDSYDGAYLKHELQGGKVKFLLSKDVPGFILPDKFYSINKLATYLDEKHQFSHDGLKLEFLRMLRMTIESQFTLEVFINELIALLDGFQKQLDRQDNDDESCSTKEKPTWWPFFAPIVWLVMRYYRGFLRA